MTEIKSVNGGLLKHMIIAAASALEANRETIDALNVFPVPDGDTGTNIAMTALAAAREAEAKDDASAGSVAKAASDGALRGARGNSGVITSQIFRGFAKGLSGVDDAHVRDFAHACQIAVETAYKAVMKPKEGTILTVARVISERAQTAAKETDDCVVFLDELIKTGDDILAKTTDMLPALKQVGVVDAGGQGLMCLLRGAYAALTGTRSTYSVSAKLPDMARVDYSALSMLKTDDIQFAYCTEFFINAGRAVDERLEDELKLFLDAIGDSIVAVCDGEIVKIHVHTNNPGEVLERALKEGQLSNIKIENMKFQHTEKISFLTEEESKSVVSGPRKKAGFVVVSGGEGFAELFRSLGADAVVEGGQSMNPSTQDVLNAIESVNAEAVFVFPNNKNIILTAEQAGKMSKKTKAVIIPTRSVPQSITALVGYNDGLSAEDNKAAMTETISYVHTGQITRAVRSTVIDGRNIDEGDVLCMFDGEIVLVEKGLETDALKKLTAYMVDNAGGEVVSVYYGKNVDLERAEAAVSALRGEHRRFEIEGQYGGQAVYSYIVSIE